MRKIVRRKTILIDGIRYYDDKPDTYRKCFFWKNRKIGCVLGTQNCYYLAEAVKTEQEKKCEGCCYAKGHPCVVSALSATRNWTHGSEQSALTALTVQRKKVRQKQCHRKYQAKSAPMPKQIASVHPQCSVLLPLCDVKR